MLPVIVNLQNLHCFGPVLNHVNHCWVVLEIRKGRVQLCGLIPVIIVRVCKGSSKEQIVLLVCGWIVIFGKKETCIVIDLVYHDIKVSDYHSKFVVSVNKGVVRIEGSKRKCEVCEFGWNTCKGSVSY